jgi:hypothetical protein
MAVDFVSAVAGGSPVNDVNLGDNIRDLALDGSGNTYVVGKFSGTVDFDRGPGVYELSSTPANVRTNYAAKYDASGGLVWARSFGGNANDGNDRELAVDSGGNVYVVGSFIGTADFGSTTLTSAGSLDAFATKIDASGNIVWAKQYGGANFDIGCGVAVDGAGNVLVLAQLLPTASGGMDALIEKLDSSNGGELWRGQFGGSTSGGRKSSTNWARASNIAVDSAGGVYATGEMGGTVDFDPSSGTTAQPGLAYVTKFTADGNFAWARNFSKSNSKANFAAVTPADIVIDANGTIFTTGDFVGSVDFDPGTQTSQKFVLTSGDSTSIRAAYASALNSSGNFLWTNSTRSVSQLSAQHTVPETIAVDGVGGVYIAGSFRGTVNFNPAATSFVLTSAGDSDAFLWNLNTNGNVLWAGQMGGTGSDSARGIAADGAGSIFVAGNFSGTADFDPGAGTYNLTSAGGYDFFIVKLAQTGALAATYSQPPNFLSADQPSSRLSNNAADDAFAKFGTDRDHTTGWNDLLNEELLLSLASARSRRWAR